MHSVAKKGFGMLVFIGKGTKYKSSCKQLDSHQQYNLLNNTMICFDTFLQLIYVSSELNMISLNSEDRLRKWRDIFRNT